MTGPTRPLVAHLGLPKAASTTLQTLLSARAARIGYLGKFESPGEDSLDRFVDPAIRNVIRMGAVLYDLRAIDLDPVRSAVAEAAERYGTDRLSLSDEGLSSIGFAHRGSTRGVAQILDNLARLAGRLVSPVLVLREQRGLLRSYHAQLVLGGYRLDYGEFVALVLERRYSWLQPVLDYSRFGDTARRACGGPLHLAAMEQLVADDTARAAFLGDAFGADFAGLPVPVLRRGRPPAEIAARLGANRRLQGRLDRTLAEYVEGHLVRYRSHRGSEALEAPLETLTARQKESTGRWSKLAAAAVRKSGEADQALLTLPPALSRALDDRIRDWNAGLADLAPKVPWRDLGYLT